jgi:DNA-binding NtrC family response regulator
VNTTKTFPYPDADSDDASLLEDLDLRRNLDRLERALIERALVVAGGNRARAARLLGIRRALLYARLKKIGVTTEPEH